MAEQRRIGFLGAGAMGQALAGGLLAAGHPREALAAADAAPERREQIAQSLGIATHADNAALVAARDMLVLAVKPHHVGDVLRGLGDAPGLDDDALRRPLWVSIAAGVSIARLAADLPSGARIVRAMPNTPALIGAGATAFAAGPHAEAADRAAARGLFESVGRVWEAAEEAQLDAVTGLSGSGPAYVFVFLEALVEAAVAEGLPREAAHELACQTVLGASRLAQESGRSPAELTAQVTSPGGTTLAGLERLDAEGFRAAVAAAVAAAPRRSRELGEG